MAAIIKTTDAPVAPADNTLEAVSAVLELKPTTRTPLEEGKIFRFRAHYGDIYHPWTHQRFTTEDERKHVVDAWINLQYVGEKIDIVTD